MLGNFKAVQLFSIYKCADIQQVSHAFSFFQESNQSVKTAWIQIRSDVLLGLAVVQTIRDLW